MLEDENLVTHDHSHQRDESEDGGQAEGAVHQSKTDERTGNHQRESSHADQRDAVFLEVEQQEEEHDNLCNHDAADNLGHGLVTVFYLAAHLAAHALRQLNLVLHDIDNLFLDGSGEDSLRKLCRHGDAALASTVHDAALAPLRTHVGNLSQGDGAVGAVNRRRGHRHRRRDAQVGYGGERHVAVVLHDDGQLVVARTHTLSFPNLSHAQLAGGGTQRQLCRTTRDAQLGRGHRVEHHVDDGRRLQIVGMHPFQFGHLPHAVHQPFSHDVQRIKVFAIESVLQLVHLQIVEPLELHVGIGERLAEARLIVGQQFQRSLVRLGVDDELGIVAAGHLRGIGIHEARRRTTDETGDARDALVFLQHAAH